MPLKTTAGNHGEAAKGRGATINPEGRFEKVEREAAEDGWFQEFPEDARPRTVIAIEKAKSVISHNKSPDLGFTQSINPYRGCEHGCSYCLEGSTLILMGDGSEWPLAELRVGDEIYGTTLDGNSRRYRKTRVLAHWSSVKPAYRMVLADGTELVGSRDHRFLVDGDWLPVHRLRAGMTMSGLERAYLRVASGEIVDEINYLHGRRTVDVVNDLASGHVAVGAPGGRRIVRIEALDRAMRLYDITTGTEDFIANGVVSHNCFARPSHGYLGLSPGIDFETRISAKTNAPQLLREELAKPGYKCSTLVVGVNTDAYQPAEREYRITRGILEVCDETHHPVSLITKSALIERDLDILVPLAQRGLVHVTLSITTLDHEISRHMEPRTSAPARRLLAVRRLSQAGVPVNVNIAPVIPFLTDHELEPIMEAAVEAGATSAFYNLVRLPWEVKDIFRAWLEANFPLKAAHVMSRIHEMRQGRDNDPNFGTRMVGTGLLAELLRQRYQKASKRLGLDRKEDVELRCDLFLPPSLHGQRTLF
jgi:DNA repair photolyase